MRQGGNGGIVGGTHWKRSFGEQVDGDGCGKEDAALRRGEPLVGVSFTTGPESADGAGGGYEDGENEFWVVRREKSGLLVVCVGNLDAPLLLVVASSV